MTGTLRRLRFSQYKAFGKEAGHMHSLGQSGNDEGGPMITGGKSVGSMGSGSFLGGLLVVGGFGRGRGRGLVCCPQTSTVRRRRSREQYPSSAFIVLS